MFRHSHLLAPALMALATPAAFAAPLPAQTPVDPRIDRLVSQLAKVKAIDAVAISPDGRKLAWVVDVEGKPAITVANADGSHAHRISAANKPGRCSESGIAWAPDSHHLAFVSDCSADTTATQVMRNTVFLADSATRTPPRRVAQLSGYVHALSWTADGASLGMLFVDGATRRASATAAAKPAVGEVGVSGVEVQRVARVNVRSGAVEQLTPAGTYVYEFDWSPDGSRIAYTAAAPPGDNNWWIAKLYVQATQPAAAAAVLVDPAAEGALQGLQMAVPRWSPDSMRVAFIGGLMSDEGATGGDIYAVPASGGVVRNLTPGVRVTPAWFTWTAPDAMLVSQVSNGESQLADYAITGDRATQKRMHFTLPATMGDGSAQMAMSLSRDLGRVAFAQSSYTAAPEVHAGALGDAAPPAVTTINAAFKPAWGKAESVQWSSDALHVQGWLLYPADYEPANSYPMIVGVHGGPSSAVIPRWPGSGFGAVPFAALGYFVFLPNPRGSYGQGESYVQANRKDFGGGDLVDILAGVDAVEKLVPVDNARLGITGWSYGGFMTMFAVTQTQRFHAAVAGAGVSNWQSYYGQNLIDQWMTPFFGATVYDDPAVYAKSSAINFIKQVKTPTLVVVGDRDAETPAPQSFEFWHALRAQNVPTSLVVYPNEGHGFVDPAHKRDVLQRALSWFGTYLPAQSR